MTAPRSFPRSARRILVCVAALQCAGIAFAQGSPAPAADRPTRAFEATQVAAVALDLEVFPVRRGEVVVTRLVDPRDSGPGDDTAGRTVLMLLVTLVLIARVVNRRT